jgi:hypothetical protein
LAGAVSWLVLAASFGLSSATWVALAVLAGFDETLDAFGFVFRLAWLMPVAYDGYVVVALIMWMSPVPAQVARFARTNTYVAAALGVAAQSCFHALTVWTSTEVVWRAGLAACVGAVPPAVSGLAVHMRALVRRHSATRPVMQAEARGISVPPPVTTPVPALPAVPAAAPMPTPVPLVAAPVTVPAVPETPLPPVPAPVAEPVVEPIADLPVVVEAPAVKRVRASKRQPSAADRVAAAIGRSPKASDATIAARLGLSEATVKRHRRQAVDSVSAASEPDAQAA